MDINAANEAIIKMLLEALKETTGNVKESLKKAPLDKVKALDYAANDAACRKAWETASNQKVF